MMDGAFRTGRVFAACIVIAVGYWTLWTLFPILTAGQVGNDVLFLADGARRLAAGQMPHADFSLPTGVLPYVNYLLAERLFPHFPSYIGSHLIGFLLLLPVLVAAASQIPSRLAAAGLIAVVSIAALLPFNIDSSIPYRIAFYASYNRLGTALALAYLAWLVRAGSRSAWLEGLIIAYALLLAFFLKIVTVGVIIGPVFVLAIFHGHWRKSALTACIVSLVALLVIELLTGTISAYIADILAMSAVNAGGAIYFFISFVFRTFAAQALVAVLVLWLLFDVFREQRAKISSRLADLSLPLAMIAAIGALCLSESQATGGLEFTAALGLLFAPGLAGRPMEMPRLVLLTMAASLIAGTLMTNAFENGLGVLLKRQGPNADVAWVDRLLRHTVVPEAMVRKAEATAALWTSADQTLRRLEAEGHTLVDRSDNELYLAQWKTVDTALVEIDKDTTLSLGRVLTLSNVDLFGLALQAEPVKGIKVVHDVGRTIRPLSPDQASTYLDGADTVFEPTCTIDQAPGAELFSSWFRNALDTEFTPRVLTPCWTMHRRKPA